MKIERVAHISIVLTFIGIVLYLGKNLLLPIVLAVFVWFIIREIRVSFNRVKFLKRYLPHWLGNILASLILFSVFGLLISIFSANVNLLSHKLPIYENNVKHVIQLINDTFKIDLFHKLETYSGNFDFAFYIKLVINSISSIFSSVSVILIYVLFLLIEESGFIHKLRAIYPDSKKLASYLDILNKIDSSVGQYLLLKTLVSLLTGLLSYAVLEFMGVDVVFFWAFIIFILNFIPTIGSLVATLFPTGFALLQFGELAPAIWILVVIGLIQVLVGNVVEPKVMGNSLNLSPLVVLLALSIWGTFWGIPGMILSVPITVVLLILFSEFEPTRPLAILLSEKGKLK